MPQGVLQLPNSYTLHVSLETVHAGEKKKKLQMDEEEHTAAVATQDLQLTQRWCRALLDVSVENGMLPPHLHQPTLQLLELGCCAGFASGQFQPLFHRERAQINPNLTYEELKQMLTPIIHDHTDMCSRCGEQMTQPRRQTKNQKRRQQRKLKKKRSREN